MDDWGTGTDGGSEPPRRPSDGGNGPQDPPLPGWMRRAPSGDFGSRGSTIRERARHRADKVRRRAPLNAPVYAYAPEPAGKPSFWSAGKGVLLGAAFAAGSLALALILVALVRSDRDDAVTDPDGGLAIAGDPTTTLPSDFDAGKVPLESPTSTTTTAPTTTEPPTTVPATAPPATAPPTTPPTTAAPTTTGPTTTRQPAPAITSFRVDRAFGFCPDRNDIRVTFSWSTTNATGAQLGPMGQGSDSVGTNSSEETCAARQSTWVLSVTGPGGTDNATVTAPS